VSVVGLTAYALPTRLAFATAEGARARPLSEESLSLLAGDSVWREKARRERRGIPHIRLGRYVRYRGEAIFLWMDELEGPVDGGPGAYPVNGASQLPT
jgi:hypothetical protein